MRERQFEGHVYNNLIVWLYFTIKKEAFWIVYNSDQAMLGLIPGCYIEMVERD